jgi:DNA-directed RNA polymerase specialized sigma24 family protein
VTTLRSEAATDSYGNSETRAGVPCSAPIPMGTHPDPAFLALVQAHEETLLRAARLLTGDWESAEDLLRDTLAWALAEWPRLAAGDGAPLLVRQRLIADFLDRYRAAPAEDADAAEDWDADTGKEGPAAAAPSTAGAAQRGGGQGFDAIAAELLSEDRALLVCRYYLDLSAAEIGEVLDIDVEEVATRSARLLAAVRARQ